MTIPSSFSERVIFAIMRLMTFFAIALLATTIVLLIIAGGSVIDWHFLTANWQQREITTGGIFPAVVGTLWIGAGVMLVSFPLGFATAVYLNEYHRASTGRRVIQVAIRNLAGVPSVIYGLFGLIVFVSFLNFNTSILSAILTLSIMALPWIITASDEALQSVPQQFRESSFALGATNIQTITRVVLPLAIPGSLTGTMIGVSRSLGETAPLMMVGATFFLSKLPSSPFDQFMALPYHIFILATQHSSPDAPAYAAATALVLIALIFSLNLAAILLRSHFRKQKDW